MLNFNHFQDFEYAWIWINLLKIFDFQHNQVFNILCETVLSAYLFVVFWVEISLAAAIKLRNSSSKDLQEPERNYSVHRKTTEAPSALKCTRKRT